MRGLAWALGGLLGCAEGSTDPCESEIAPTLEVGTGEVAFEPLETGGELRFIAGPQGGYHVFVSLIATGITPGTGSLAEPDDPVVTVDLSSSDKALSTFVDRRRPFAPSGEGLELVGQLVVLDHPEPPVFDGEPAALGAVVEDRCGRMVSDTVEVTLVLQAPDP